MIIWNSPSFAAAWPIFIFLKLWLLVKSFHFLQVNRTFLIDSKGTLERISSTKSLGRLEIIVFVIVSICNKLRAKKKKTFLRFLWLTAVEGRTHRNPKWSWASRVLQKLVGLFVTTYIKGKNLINIFHMGDGWVQKMYKL